MADDPAIPPAAPGPTDARPAGWKSARERGSLFALRLVVVTTTLFGRALPRLFLAPAVALYYLVFAREARAAARGFLRRVHGREPTLRELYAPFLRFVQVTLDALFIVRGKHHHYTATQNGHEHLEALRAAGQGAILLGAHLGSFHAMRMRSGAHGLRLYPVVYTKNARIFNDLLDELDPDNRTTLLEMDPEAGMDFMLRIREIVESGGLVAILGDRADDEGRTVLADFLGEPARFPAGPYLLASMLRCPVYLVLGLHEPPSHYELFCEPFAERIELPRKQREEALAGYVRAYAARLEHHARAHPDNWFNFYDFWKK
jgi:predicted LPLAT superfamily acyltransferase